MKSFSNNIKSIVLFGSYARGDYNQDSDYDLCVFTSDKHESEAYNLDFNTLIKKNKKTYLNLTVYPHSILNQMLEYGSLFLWHLYIEGKILYGTNYINKQFNQLNKFDKHLEELDYHKKLFLELKDSMNKIGYVSYFDYSLLFTISRNICMVLSHKFGRPKFGRFETFNETQKIFNGLPISLIDYQFLSNFKIIYDRDNSNFNLKIDTDFNIYYFNIVEKLLNFSYAKLGY
jgi:predicted nucleotidyltransferase